MGILDKFSIPPDVLRDLCLPCSTRVVRKFLCDKLKTEFNQEWLSWVSDCCKRKRIE